MPRRRAHRIVRQYEVLLGLVLADAWGDWCELGLRAPVQRGRLGRSSRAFDVSDFILEHVRRRFAGVGGVSIVMEYGRPMLVLADGLVKVRFKKLDPKLGVSVTANTRQANLGLHLLPPMLPGMGQPTVLTVGYILDSTETRIARALVVCHVRRRVHYSIDLPLPLPALQAVPFAPAAGTAIAGSIVTSTRAGSPQTGTRRLP